MSGCPGQAAETVTAIARGMKGWGQEHAAHLGGSMRPGAWLRSNVTVKEDISPG